tara:strand:+ start:117 stop:272 length:156 start_codon:yes stop_codon:yes gene_type:complete
MEEKLRNLLSSLLQIKDDLEMRDASWVEINEINKAISILEDVMVENKIYRR